MEARKSPDRRPGSQYPATQPSTLPRQRSLKPDNISMSRHFGNDLAAPQHRGYYSLGRDTRSLKTDPSSQSDYGVAISIKGIEGTDNYLV